MGCDRLITGQRVGQIENEVKVSSEPKLLNHGGNMAVQGDYNHLAERGTGKPYILARLKRYVSYNESLPPSFSFNQDINILTAGLSGSSTAGA